MWQYISWTQYSEIYVIRQKTITVSTYNLMKQNGIRNLKICVKSLMMMQISTIQNKIINTKLKLV